MLSPRWTKLLRDVQLARGRMLMMVVAIGAGIFGLGTILSTYSILTREVSTNYLGTHPASAWIETDHVDEKLVLEVNKRAGIEDAEAGSTVTARVRSKGEWKPLLLFVVEDFNHIKMNSFEHESGAWPPPDNTLLLERKALTFLGSQVGDRLTVQKPDGPKRSVTISGLTHDPGLAPAEQEQTAYGYITPATMSWLGETGGMHVLKVSIAGNSRDPAVIRAATVDLAAWLETKGRTVEEIRIPPPGMHPHQSQMKGVLTVFLIFSAMALLLSAVLTATMINGLLAQQMRQIGIMKAIGARSFQISGVYLVLVAVIGSVAVLLGLPPAITAGRALAQTVADLLNFTLHSTAVPLWVYMLGVLSGILVPLAVAIWPIRRSARTTIRETLDDYGVSREAFKAGRLDGWLRGIKGFDHMFQLAVRNAFRRRGRLILTLILLITAGATFITGINIKTGWESSLREAARGRTHDVEVRLSKPQPTGEVLPLLEAIPGVKSVETWALAAAAIDRGDGFSIVQTYPDGGHGSLALRPIPAGGALTNFPMISGRLLQAGDTNGVVINQMAAAKLPGIRPGDTLRLRINDRSTEFRLTGIVRQLLTPATAYASFSAFASASGLPVDRTDGIRIVADQRDAAFVATLSSKIEQELESQGVGVRMMISEAMLEEAQSGHVYLFIFVLMAMSALLAVVGALGLMSTVGTGVIERTREFGIMRAIGGNSPAILRGVIGEGVFVGLLSWIAAPVISIPLTLAIGNLIGNMSFKAPLPLIVSPAAIVTWLAIILLGSLAASALPARKASQLTIRETLSHT